MPPLHAGVQSLCRVLVHLTPKLGLFCWHVALHQQGEYFDAYLDRPTLKMESPRSFRRPVTIYPSIRCSIPQDLGLQRIFSSGIVWSRIEFRRAGEWGLSRTWIQISFVTSHRLDIADVICFLVLTFQVFDAPTET
jgi:hypothetical protein